MRRPPSAEEEMRVRELLASAALAFDARPELTYGRPQRSHTSRPRWSSVAAIALAAAVIACAVVLRDRSSTSVLAALGEPSADSLRPVGPDPDPTHGFMAPRPGHYRYDVTSNGDSDLASLTVLPPQPVSTGEESPTGGDVVRQLFTSRVEDTNQATYRYVSGRIDLVHLRFEGFDLDVDPVGDPVFLPAHPTGDRTIELRTAGGTLAVRSRSWFLGVSPVVVGTTPTTALNVVTTSAVRSKNVDITQTSSMQVDLATGLILHEDNVTHDGSKSTTYSRTLQSLEPEPEVGRTSSPPTTR
jgi:hypothetical protein